MGDATYNNEICCIFIPTNVWKKCFDENLNVNVCVITNELKTKYKAVKCKKIENEIDDQKDDEEEKEIIYKNDCYISRDLEKLFDVGLSDEELKKLKNGKNVGTKFKMADIEYVIEEIGDFVKCKQVQNNSKEFPDLIYLQKNQLNFVEIIIEEDDEDKSDPFAVLSFYIAIDNENKLQIPCIYSLVYTTANNEDTQDSFIRCIKENNVPITNGDTLMHKYQIVEIRDAHGLILPFGQYIDNKTKIKYDSQRSALNSSDSCLSFSILDCMELEPILIKKDDENKKEEKDEEIKEEEPEKKELPEWFVTISQIKPGQPMKLYAIAYREANKNMEAAVNWLMDKGEKYLIDNFKEFEEDAVKNSGTWNCAVCTFKNPGANANCEMCLSPKPIEAVKV